jgi:hypothetical protein
MRSRKGVEEVAGIGFRETGALVREAIPDSRKLLDEWA